MAMFLAVQHDQNLTLLTQKTVAMEILYFNQNTVISVIVSNIFISQICLSLFLHMNR